MSGWLVGFPIVAGPILLFYTLEQGHAFAAAAAQGALIGLLSLCVYISLFTVLAIYSGWMVSLAAGWVGFFAVTWAMKDQIVPWPWALLAAFSGFAVTLWGLPSLNRPEKEKPPRGDLFFRMAATAVLVLALTGLAEALGPSLSGYLTPFPVASTVLAVFAHKQGGAAAVIAVYRGFLPGLYGFSVFCAVIAANLETLGLVKTFLLGIAAVTCVQGLIFIILHSKDSFR